MSENKWTPGPWQVSGVRSAFPSKAAKPIWVGPDGRSIAAVMFSDLTPAEFVASNADARLIAAAPDLYEALVSMLTAADAYGREVSDAERKHFSDAWAKARAALAKARGKTP